MKCCYICKMEFSSNNCLHQHIKKNCQWNNLISESEFKSVYINHVKLIKAELAEIINSDIIKLLEQSFSFCTYYYITVKVWLSLEDFTIFIYMNSNCSIMLIDRLFLLEHLLNVRIEQLKALFAV